MQKIKALLGGASGGDGDSAEEKALAEESKLVWKLKEEINPRRVLKPLDSMFS